MRHPISIGGGSLQDRGRNDQGDGKGLHRNPSSRDMARRLAWTGFGTLRNGSKYLRAGAALFLSTDGARGSGARNGIRTNVGGRLIQMLMRGSAGQFQRGGFSLISRASRNLRARPRAALPPSLQSRPYTETPRSRSRRLGIRRDQHRIKNNACPSSDVIQGPLIASVLPRSKLDPELIDNVLLTEQEAISPK